MSRRNAGVHARGTAYVCDCARGSHGGYSVLVSMNRTGNQRPVTAAILFLKTRRIFNSFRTFQLMMVINTITCKYVVISYSCITSA